MDPENQGLFEAYFRTFNAGDEEAHRALWGPDLDYFSSTVRTSVQGLGSLRGVWKAIREGVGIRRIEPKKWFGDLPERAVLVSFQGEGGKPSVEAMMVFRFDEANLISHLSVHWDPVAFLKAKEFPGEPVASRESLEAKDPRVQGSLGHDRSVPG